MKYKFRFIPIAPDGWKFILAFLVVGGLLVVSHAFASLAGGLLLAAAGFSAWFFRDPERAVPKTDDVLAPADGTVMEVASVDGEGYGRGTVARVFLSVFDGHVQFAPVRGTVRSVVYQPGLFLDARDPRASFINESNAIEIESPRGRVVVKQIAGLIARRILCWVRKDDAVDAGERIGLIRFGSQVDLYLPAGVEWRVKEGDRVVAGMTVMAAWGTAVDKTTLVKAEAGSSV
jgi:phosphatidylserine decarboxylase